MANAGDWVGPFDDPDRYELVESRSSGGEGEVWRAHRPLDRMLLPVAVKIVHERHMANAREWQKRWQRQTELLRSLDHPALVRVREFFEGPAPHLFGAPPPPDRSLYLAMNWEKGVSLQSWVRARSRSPENILTGLGFLRSVAGAVDYLHRGDDTGLPVIHRDIKPANILITGPVVRLVDFGLARLQGDSSMTFGGTKKYLAPETLNGDFSPSSDRYALGATAYFVIVGEPPGPDPRHRVAALRGAAVGRPDAVAEAVLEMLDPDPRQRPESAVDWIQAVIRLAAGPSATDRAGPRADLSADGGESSRTLPEHDDVTYVRPGPTPPVVEPSITFVEPATTVVAHESDTVPVDRSHEAHPRRRPVWITLGIVLVAMLGGAGAFLWWPDRLASDPPTTSEPDPPAATASPFPQSGEVTSGRYASRRMKPAVVFQLRNGWTSKGEGADILELSPSAQPNRQVSVVRVQRIYRPDKFNADPSALNGESTALNAVDRVPDDTVNWLQSLPATTRSQVRDVVVGGRKAREVDVTLSGVNYTSCAAPCRLLFQLDPSPPDNATKAFIRFAGQKARFQVVDLGVAKVVVVLSAPVGEFDDFMDRVKSDFEVQSVAGAEDLTSVSIVSPSTGVKAGQPATLVAEVKGACASAQTGTLVSFYEGAIRDNKLYGSAPLNADGRASLDVASIRSADRQDVAVVVAQSAGTSDCERSTSPPLYVPLA